MTPPLRTPKQTPTPLKDIHGPHRARSRAEHTPTRIGTVSVFARWLTLGPLAALAGLIAAMVWLVCTYLLHTTGPAAVLLAVLAAGAAAVKLHRLHLRTPPPEPVTAPTRPTPTRSRLAHRDQRKDS
jgi:hypothetical protein